jgi:hypothetical protein
MAQRKKLILLASSDPRSDPEPIRRAYLWATTAAREGLEAEVRLVGEAVRAARPDEIREFARREELRAQMQAGADHAFLVSL